MDAEIIILSGTRDELGGVEIGIVNVYRRPERPGGLSAQLVLPEREQVIGVGDLIDLGGQQFRLSAIVPHRTGAYKFHFRQEAPEPSTPERRSTARAIPPISVTQLIRHLRQVSPQILGALATDGAVFEIANWSENSKDSMTTEWNGMQSGPSTHRTFGAHLTGGHADASEASIQHDILRYDPSEIYRQEVSGWWKLGNRHVHIFVRCEGLAEATELWSSDLPEPIFALITSYA